MEWKRNLEWRKNEEVIIKRLLDIGADGVIVPMINSANDAKKQLILQNILQLARRGVGLYRASKYGTAFNEYKDFVEKELVIIAQYRAYVKAVENHLEVYYYNEME